MRRRILVSAAAVLAVVAAGPASANLAASATPAAAPAASAAQVAAVAGGPAAAPAASTPNPSPGTSRALAAKAATGVVSSRPVGLRATPDDAFAQLSVVSGTDGLQYVPVARTHKGVPVIGGDFVVVTNANGAVLNTVVGQQAPLAVSTKAAISPAQAATLARAKGVGRAAVTSTRLIVDATGSTGRLAYESVVTGNRGAVPSKLHVFVDARTGAVVRTYDEVVDNNGSGTGWINGPTPFTIQTSGSGTAFTMTDPTRPGISCRNFSGHAVLSGTDDVWGNGVGTNLETGCADALYSVQHEWSMLSAWLGRNGINGSGGGFPIYMGLNDENAYWDGASVSIGHNTANQWISSLDVVGHEFGHAIDSTTPGGQSANGVSEATGDIFGALSEAYANEPAAFDPPDYLVGEEVNLVGSGPIRNMSNPSTVGDPNCYSSSIPGAETHAAAGPFDHWFYLVAQGSNPTNGFPVSPTCNGTTVGGALGNINAGKVFYNAMLTKTTNMTYLKYRTATLTSAKNLFPGNCAPFNTVKAAWNAVSVPAQAADPTCTVGGPPVVSNPGARTGTVGVATSLQLAATGGTAPLTWSATGLPAGLAVNASTGLVSGTPTTVGTSTVTATATGGGTGSATFTWTISAKGTCPSPGQKLGNPGFEVGTAPWTATAGVIGSYGSSGQPTHGGTRNAWLDGYGATHSDSLTQSVAIPAGCSAQLSFWLHIDSAETTTTVQYDKLTVKAGATTLATYSNLNKGAGYTLRTFNVSAFAGTTVTVSFAGTEDTSLQTSFVIDDTALTTS